MTFLGYTVIGVYVLLGISILLVLTRLVKGPNLPDRVVALDMIAVIAVGIIAVDAVATGQIHSMRAGMVLALMAFLGTLAFAMFMLEDRRRE